MDEQTNAANTAGGTGTAQPQVDGGSNTGRAGAASHDDGREPAWLGKRLERAQRTAREELLSELGIGPDEIGSFKDVLGKHRETESEVVKERRLREQREKDLAKVTGELNEHRTRERTRSVHDVLRQAISAEAASGRHVIDPEDLVLSLSDSRRSAYVGHAEDGTQVVVENGQPARGKDVAAFVKAYLDSRPALLKPIQPAGGAGSRVGGGSGAAKGEVDLKTATFAEKAAAAKASFRERMKKE